jgi:hypothetical protein
LSNVEDRDLGLRAIYAAAKRFDRTIVVGIRDPDLTKHAIAHEMATGFMRGTFDDRQRVVDLELGDLLGDVTDGIDPELGQLDIAEGYQVAFRDALATDELEDRDEALEDAIEVEVDK